MSEQHNEQSTSTTTSNPTPTLIGPARIAVHYLLSEAGRRSCLSKGVGTLARQQTRLLEQSSANGLFTCTPEEWALACELARFNRREQAEILVGHELRDHPHDSPSIEYVPLIQHFDRGLGEPSTELVGSGTIDYGYLPPVAELLHDEAQRRADVARVQAAQRNAQEADRLRRHRERIEQNRAACRAWLAGLELAVAGLEEVQRLEEIIESPSDEDPGDPSYDGGKFGRAPIALAKRAVEEERAIAGQTIYLATLDADGIEARAARQAQVSGLANGHKPSTILHEMKLAAQRAVDLREMDLWAAQHGSPRLVRCIRENLECRAIYRDERLAVERPGWRWVGTDRDGGEVSGKIDEARNPSEGDLELLDKARTRDPQCKLVRWTWTEEDGSDGDWILIAVGDFLGRQIMFVK